MKRIAYFLTMALMLPLFAACSDDTEEMVEPEVQKTIKGTDTRDNDNRPYWWVLNEKVYFHYLDNRAFIYYHPSNKEVIVQKLAERGLTLLKDQDDPFIDMNPSSFSNKGESFEFLHECLWNEVSASYKDVIDIPEILDACPNPKLEGVSGRTSEPSGTSLIYVGTTSLTILQQIAEEYNVHIYGTFDYIKCSFIVCDKNSKGNAFDIARDIAERNIAWAEPAMAGSVEAC